MGEKRLSYIDVAKGFGILMIVYGHLSYLSNPIADFFSSSEVPIFYVLSGMIFAYKREKMKRIEIKAFVKKKFHTLMLPYFYISTVVVILDMLYMLIREKRNITEVFWDDLCKIFSFRGLSTLWFLPTLFFAAAFFLILSKAAIRSCIILIPAGICMFVKLSGIFCNGAEVSNLILYPSLVALKSLGGMWFYMIGFYLKYWLERINSKPYGVIWLFIIAAGILNVVMSAINMHVDFNYMRLGCSPGIYFINGVVGSLFWIELSFLLCKIMPCIFLQFCGRNSLFIMLTHLPLYLCSVVSHMTKKVIETICNGRYRIAIGIGDQMVILFEFAILMLIEVLMIKGKEKIQAHRQIGEKA